MSRSSSAISSAIVIAALLAIAGGALIWQRGGVFAYVGAIVGVGLLVKTYARPSARDRLLSISALLVWLAAWAGTAFYVFSTWESGEVVDLVIDTSVGPHAARVWVVDAPDASVVVYDTAPAIADALMRGRSASLTRKGRTTRTLLDAKPAAAMRSEEVDAIFQLMNDKYGNRNRATEVFYQLLGGARDRRVMILKFNERV